jgi:integrase
MAHINKRTVRKEARYDVIWREHNQTRSRTFIREKDAQRFRTDITRKAQLGTLYEEAAITVGEAMASFLERWELGVSSSTATRKKAAWPHFAVLEQVPLVALRPAVLEDTTVAAAKVAPRQAQMGLGLVKQVLRDAQKRGQRFDPLLLNVAAPGYEEREPVFLTYPELVALSAAMPADRVRREMTLEESRGWIPETIRRFPLFGGLSGLRLGELLGLLDTDLDLGDGSVLVQRSFTGRTKSRKRRRVDLCPEAVHIAREQLLARSPNERGLIFPTATGLMWNPNNFRARVWRPAVTRLAKEAKGARADDLARLHVHDLRHSYASLMVAASANPLQIAAALGHTDGKGQPDASLIWKRYGHLYPASGREAAVRLSEFLQAVAS